MAEPTVFQGDIYVNGTLVAKNIFLPVNVVTDATVIAAANVAASKLEHQHQLKAILSEDGDPAAPVVKPIHRVKGATATIVSFGVTARTPAGGGGSATIDLRKNGVTILTAPFNIDDGDAAFALVSPAGYTSTDLVADDQLDVHVTAAAGTPPEGLTAWLVVREKAQ